MVLKYTANSGVGKAQITHYKQLRTLNKIVAFRKIQRHVVLFCKGQQPLRRRPVPAVVVQQFLSFPYVLDGDEVDADGGAAVRGGAVRGVRGGAVVEAVAGAPHPEEARRGLASLARLVVVVRRADVVAACVCIGIETLAPGGEFSNEAPASRSRDPSSFRALTHM